MIPKTISVILCAVAVVFIGAPLLSGEEPPFSVQIKPAIEERDPKKAEAIVLVALDKDPGNLSLIEFYVSTLMAQEKFEKVVSTVRLAESRGIVSPFLYLQQARSFLMVKDKSEMLGTFFKMERLVYDRYLERKRQAKR